MLLHKTTVPKFRSQSSSLSASLLKKGIYFAYNESQYRWPNICKYFVVAVTNFKMLKKENLTSLSLSRTTYQKAVTGKAGENAPLVRQIPKQADDGSSQ